MPEEKSLPSLKPPKDFFDRMYAKIKKENPKYDDEKVRRTVGNLWYHEMGEKKKKEERAAEGKKYGSAEKSVIAFNGASFAKSKAAHSQAASMHEIKRSPVVVVDYYNEEGKFERKECVTAPMVLKAPKKYDSETFAILIQGLSQNLGWEKIDEKLDLIIELAETLKARRKEEKEAREKLEKESGAQKPEIYESNWQRKTNYYFGKSLMMIEYDEEFERIE